MEPKKVGPHPRVVTQHTVASEEAGGSVAYRICLECQARGVNDLDLALRQCRTVSTCFPVDMPV